MHQNNNIKSSKLLTKIRICPFLPSYLYIFSKIHSLVILGKDMSVSKEVSKKVEEEASEGITLYCHHHITALFKLLL